MLSTRGNVVISKRIWACLVFPEHYPTFNVCLGVEDGGGDSMLFHLLTADGDNAGGTSEGSVQLQIKAASDSSRTPFYPFNLFAAIYNKVKYQILQSGAAYFLLSV